MNKQEFTRRVLALENRLYRISCGMLKNPQDRMDAVQEAVMKAAYEAAVWQRQAMQDYQLESRAACEAAGCEIIEVDVPSFQTAVASVYDKYPQYKEIVDMINAVK